MLPPLCPRLPAHTTLNIPPPPPRVCLEHVAADSPDAASAPSPSLLCTSHSPATPAFVCLEPADIQSTYLLKYCTHLPSLHLRVLVSLFSRHPATPLLVRTTDRSEGLCRQRVRRLPAAQVSQRACPAVCIHRSVLLASAPSLRRSPSSALPPPRARLQLATTALSVPKTLSELRPSLGCNSESRLPRLVTAPVQVLHHNFFVVRLPSFPHARLRRICPLY